MDPRSNIPALVQEMAWHQIGDKPLYEPMLNQFRDVYMRQLGEMSFSKGQECWQKGQKEIVCKCLITDKFHNSKSRQTGFYLIAITIGV